MNFTGYPRILVPANMGRPTPQITRAAMNELALHDWPGNIRELQNVVERAVIVSAGGPLEFNLPRPAPPAARVAPEAAASNPLTREQLKLRERENIVQALDRTEGKIFGPGGAAEMLGMKPTTLASRVRALRISTAPAT